MLYPYRHLTEGGLLAIGRTATPPERRGGVTTPFSCGSASLGAGLRLAPSEATATGLHVVAGWRAVAR
ncbi:hypothetical protein QQG74_21595 [Micromonospora sp. FIMYZ51]|uniref:hypothetical protein n=1 Tax=Micromonospora sp. FIMYZ51 TaxID=3051832 RepID=UPI00311DDE32